MPKTRFEIESDVYKVVSETFPGTSETLAPETMLKADLGADSMQLIALMIALDAEFDAEFAIEQIPRHDVSLEWVCEFVLKTIALDTTSRT